MAFVAGKDSYLTINNLNIGSALANEVTWSGDSDEIDVSTMGGNWKAFIQGQSGVSLSVNGVWDNGTATTSIDAVLYAMQNGGGTKLYEWMPGGSASAKHLYKGNCFLTGYEVSASNKDKVAFSAKFRVSDTPTRTIVA